jgi:hypothetical protein
MNQKHGRKSWGKRGITIFLTLSLMVSLLSTAAYAAEGDDTNPSNGVEADVNGGGEGTGGEGTEGEGTEGEGTEGEGTEGEGTEGEGTEGEGTEGEGTEGEGTEGEGTEGEGTEGEGTEGDGDNITYCENGDHTWNYDAGTTRIDGCITYAVYPCINNDTSLYEPIAGEHTWDYSAGTSEDDGCYIYMVYPCINGDTSLYSPIAENHTWDQGVSKQDGCKTTVTYTCSVCFATKIDESYNHKWTTYPCSTGWVYQYCSKCKELSEEQVYAVPTVAHTGSGWQWEDEDRAVCESGWQYTECTVCGTTLGYRYADSDVAHTWGDWVVTREATACSTGSRYHECTVCPAWDDETIPATGNSEHTWGDWVVTEEATACGTGERYRECTVCDTADWEIIPATGNGEHTWGDWVVEREATACSTGYRYHECKVCGDWAGEWIPATGTGEHSWGEWKVLVPATCASGVQARTCSVCDLTMQQLIPPVTSGHVHTWSNWQLTEDYGCEGGILTRYCTAAEDASEDYYDIIWKWVDCDDFVEAAVDTEQKKVTGTGTHDWGDWKPVAQTTCYDIEQVRQCKKCGVEEYKTLEGTGKHNWGEWEEVAAGKCWNSFKIRYCQNDGCYESEKDKTDQEIYHHTAAGRIYVASCIRSDYYQAYTYCIWCGMDYICDENGNQLFDESGNAYWPENRYGYNPNNHEGGTKLVNAVAATATTDGYSGDLYCLGCDKLIKKGDVIPATTGTASSSPKTNSTAANPKTGDESSLVLWVSSLGISFAALALLAVWNKKRYTGKEK